MKRFFHWKNFQFVKWKEYFDLLPYIEFNYNDAIITLGWLWWSFSILRLWNVNKKYYGKYWTIINKRVYLIGSISTISLLPRVLITKDALTFLLLGFSLEIELI